MMEEGLCEYINLSIIDLHYYGDMWMTRQAKLFPVKKIYKKCL